MHVHLVAKRRCLVAASNQFPLLEVGQFGVGGIPPDVGQFSPYRSPGQSERTRGTHRASSGDRWDYHQHVSPAKRCGPGEDGRYQKTASGPPSGKARKGHLIKAATSLGQREDRGERDPAEKPEYSEEEPDREIGIDAEHPTWHGAHSAPYCRPGEAYSDCTANSSQPVPHDRLRVHRRGNGQPPPAAKRQDFCDAKYNRGRPE
jgi:hypothetical protein